MTKRTIGLLVATGILAACAGSPQTTDTKDDAREETATAAADLRLPTIPIARDTLLAADARVANEVSLRGVPGLLANLADDAVLLLRRENLLSGKAAIAAYYAAHPVPGTLGWRYARGDVSALGDFGYTLGWLEIIGPQDADGLAAASYSVYVATWARRHDGWKITAFSKTDLGGPPAPPPANLSPLTGDGPVYPSVRGEAAAAADMMAADTAFAAYTQTVGRQKGFDAYVDPDGIAINDPLFVGRQQIFDSNADVPPGYTLEWQPVLARASKSGDLGFTVGTYKSGSTAPDGTRQNGYGKYITVWRRQADGTMKWVVDGGSSSPAPAPVP